MNNPKVKTLSIGFLIMMMSLSSPAYSESYEWSEKMKGSYKKGFLLSCEPNIKSQLERAGILDLTTQTQRLSYCVCVGIKIFDDLTISEINSFQKTMELPARKKKARSSYSNECTDKHF